jgi:hypothetical protein
VHDHRLAERIFRLVANHHELSISTAGVSRLHVAPGILAEIGSQKRNNDLTRSQLD